MSALLLLIIMSAIFLVVPYVLIKYWYRNIRFKLKDVIIWHGLEYHVTAVIRLEGKSEYLLMCVIDMDVISKMDSNVIDSEAILKSQYNKIKEMGKS